MRGPGPSAARRGHQCISVMVEHQGQASLEHPRVFGTGVGVGDEPSELGIHLELPLVGEAIGRHVPLGIDAFLPAFRISGSESEQEGWAIRVLGDRR